MLFRSPPELLWARKQEGTFEALARRRDEYLRLREAVEGVKTVDATQPEDAVVRQTSRLILDRLGMRNGT